MSVPAQKLKDNLVERDLWLPLVKIAKAHRVSIDEVLGPSRQSFVVRARHACMVHLSEREGFSSTTIGHLLGRDHSTVLYALKRARESAKAQGANVSGDGPERAT